MNFSEEQIVNVLSQAYVAGEMAGNAEIGRIVNLMNTGQIGYIDCGGAWINIDIDGRSNLAKKLTTLNLDFVSIENARSSRNKGYSVSFRFRFTLINPVSGQEKWIYQSAYEAALPIIKSGLNVDGYVRPYIT
ncbi:hypothetical protein CGT94_18350 [Vibrio metoecus]|uniref:hypothetical protein n=1 Tax=Vibrio metoecus TaxID=1481663 RepID=UPI0006D81E0B|nr:hypothetical protein [Vibrio metoecus]EGQ9440943.1 hypothetical protein [Vibrio cholerae]EGR1465863.1 hypothetical protein [Vibrio cholerae]ELH4197990.1 hypothetical protein [Vibrio cholerae]KQB07068.1 hypothetical protein XV93_04400 [Vibrio metoecus]PAR45428.1 hypothetical protein CGT94_18350 [Vibrio metoecus]